MALLAMAVTAVIGPPSLGILRVAGSPGWVLRAAGICGFVRLAAVALRRIATGAAFFRAGLARLVTVALPNTIVRPERLGLPGRAATYRSRCSSSRRRRSTW